MKKEATDICMICGKERPVSCIDILEKDQTKYLEVIEKTVIHFCNDNASCFFGAEKKRLASKKVEEGP
jgi:hypothetical protein